VGAVKVALVHDWLNQRGGAESVLEALVALYPDAPVHTSIYAQEAMPKAYRRWDIRPTWMDRLPGIYERHQQYLPLYPVAFGRMNLSGYDLVISNKSGFCHGVRTGPKTPHICYCLTPTRFLWFYDEYVAREQISPAVAYLLKPLIIALRQWDRWAARRVDYFVAISSEVQRRIKRVYKRDSVVIYPPVDTRRYAPSSIVDGYCLVVSRLVPYKHVSLAVEACSMLGLPLLVAGEGRDRARLEGMAGSTVEFLGRVPDRDLPDLMARCRVFLFPGLEDFGIAPVEAQAAGRPVIAYRGGGALDTIVEGETGIFFDEQTPEALCDALRRLADMRFDPGVIRANAERFDVAHFVNDLTRFVEGCLAGR
jgi:glycosyltransferase involved in cell wall biosynthesis